MSEVANHMADCLLGMLGNYSRGLLFLRAQQSRPPGAARDSDHDPNVRSLCVGSGHGVRVAERTFEQTPVTL